MEKYKTLPHDKSDIKDLESYLVKNDLVDDRKIWFAGFPYIEGAEQNAIAGNLFYGNKRLKIVAVKDETIYYFHNKKDEFSIYTLGNISDKKYVKIKQRLLYPIIEIEVIGNDMISLQINKNKVKLKEFKKL